MKQDLFNIIYFLIFLFSFVYFPIYSFEFGNPIFHFGPSNANNKFTNQKANDFYYECRANAIRRNIRLNQSNQNNEHNQSDDCTLIPKLDFQQAIVKYKGHIYCFDVTKEENYNLVLFFVWNLPYDEFLNNVALKYTEEGQKRIGFVTGLQNEAYANTFSNEEFVKKYKNELSKFSHSGFTKKIKEILNSKNEKLIEELISVLNDYDFILSYDDIIKICDNSKIRKRLKNLYKFFFDESFCNKIYGLFKPKSGNRKFLNKLYRTYKDLEFLNSEQGKNWLKENEIVLDEQTLDYLHKLNIELKNLKVNDVQFQNELLDFIASSAEIYKNTANKIYPSIADAQETYYMLQNCEQVLKNFVPLITNLSDQGYRQELNRLMKVLYKLFEKAEKCSDYAIKEAAYFVNETSNISSNDIPRVLISPSNLAALMYSMYANDPQKKDICNKMVAYLSKSQITNANLEFEKLNKEKSIRENIIFNVLKKSTKLAHIRGWQEDYINKGINSVIEDEKKEQNNDIDQKIYSDQAS